MPTVIEEDGFKIRVLGPPREHPPIHAHVEQGRAGLAIIRLRTTARPQEVWAVYGMKTRDVLRAYRLVEKYDERIRQTWRKLHEQA